MHSIRDNGNGKRPSEVASNGEIAAILVREEKARAICRDIPSLLGQSPVMPEKPGLFPPRPPQVRGELFKIGRYFRQKHRRFLELDVVRMRLVKYQKREDYPERPKEMFPLLEILAVKMRKGKGGDSSPSGTYHYFKVPSSSVLTAGRS